MPAVPNARQQLSDGQKPAAKKGPIRAAKPGQSVAAAGNPSAPPRKLGLNVGGPQDWQPMGGADFSAHRSRSATGPDPVGTGTSDYLQLQSDRGIASRRTTRAFAVESQLKNTMTCAELAQRIERMQPTATPQDVARLCLLLTNSVEELEALREPVALGSAWKRTGLQLQAATDQHAAMTADLEALAASDPKSFDQDQIWVLIRAIKVQSQVLQMYVGHPLLDV
jgi:hypothetical protein